MQIEAAMPDPFKGAPMARLEYVTRGIKGNQEARGGNEGGAASEAAYYSTPSCEDESGMGANRRHS